MRIGFHWIRRKRQPKPDKVPLARTHAERALELSPGEPDAHRVLAQIAATHDYNWKEAKEHFRLARASEPIPPGFRVSYAMDYLAPLGRFEEALQEEAQAILQDPLNAVWRMFRAGTFFLAGMYERTIVEAREARELGDRSHIPLVMMAECYFYQGRFVEAGPAAEEGFRVAPWDALATGFLARVLMDAGEKDRAQGLLARLPSMPLAGIVSYHLAGSEMDAAFDWYEKALEQRQPFAALWASSAQLRPLRTSPRWPKLANLMNLPESLQ